ncbi:MAG TPA: ATP-binding protein [Dissulfurispiraceae bacterium]|nr:ATP-binding protein [Dissulfurispiraceae bacterium]
MTIKRKLALIFAFYVALSAIMGYLIFTELTALHDSLKVSDPQGSADNSSLNITASASISHAKNLLFAGAAIILVSGALVSVFLARSLVLPIRRLQDAARRMAMGDLSAEIEISGDSEIASLCKSFNSMQIILRNVLDSLDGSLKELKEKQSQLVKTEKLAAIGVFASGVAHEINNPLTSVLTFSNLLLEKMPEEDPRCEMLRIMSREAMRARGIVKQLLSFSRDAAINPVNFDINETIRESIKTLSLQEALQGISIELNLADDLPAIYADQIQIEEVLWNIMANAADAITSPGVIAISTCRNETEIIITIADTGAGVPEEYLDKIFDPFFSTKGTAGTGLGLAVSYDIIKKHGGNIDVFSTVNEGTTFTIRLTANERDQGISS